MTTNILAHLIITLVTNVVKTDNAVYEQDFMTMYATNPPQYGQRLKTPATERYTTTNVIERAALTWDLWGEKRTQVVERPISSVTATERLDQAWRKVGVRTNDTAVGSAITNMIWLPSVGSIPLDWTRKDNAK